jgi:hypothetical protein
MPTHQTGRENEAIAMLDTVIQNGPSHGGYFDRWYIQKSNRRLGPLTVLNLFGLQANASYSIIKEQQLPVIMFFGLGFWFASALVRFFFRER